MNPKWRSLEILKGALGDVGNAVTGYIQNKRAFDEEESRRKAFDQFYNTEISRPENAGATGGMPSSEDLWRLSGKNPAAAMGAMSTMLGGRRPKYDVSEDKAGGRSIITTLPGQKPTIEQVTPGKQEAGINVDGRTVNSVSEARAEIARLSKENPAHPAMQQLRDFVKSSDEGSAYITSAPEREKSRIEAESRKATRESQVAYGTQMAKAQEDVNRLAAELQTALPEGGSNVAPSKYAVNKKQRTRAQVQQELNAAKSAWADAYEKLAGVQPDEPGIAKYRSQYDRFKKETGGSRFDFKIIK